MLKKENKKMKKILVIFAVVAAACVANAASFKWSASGITGYNTTEAYTGSASLYAYLSTADSSTAVVVDTATMTAGAIAANDTVFSDTVNFATGSSYVFYYTLEDADGNVFTSGSRTVKAQATATVPLGFASTGSWAAADIPEPTSGLLLLLGVAGLALRRKKA